jgi:uncharacterized protein (DUF4415 family)
MPLRKNTEPSIVNPQWTKVDFKTAIHLPGTTLAEATSAARRGRGAQKEPKKIAISIRLHPDIIKHFKSGGAGWQSRMEKVLERVSVGKKG